MQTVLTVIIDSDTEIKRIRVEPFQYTAGPVNGKGALAAGVELAVSQPDQNITYTVMMGDEVIARRRFESSSESLGHDGFAE